MFILRFFFFLSFFFFFNDPATTEIYTLSLHDALPISLGFGVFMNWGSFYGGRSADVELQGTWRGRSEEHTSELQSHSDLVCRLLLEKKKKERKHDRPTHMRVRHDV